MLFSGRNRLLSFAKTTTKSFVQTTRMRNVLSRSVVSIQEAKNMPKTYSEFSNEILLSMALNGDQLARQERLIRDIMATDTIEWTEANKIFDGIIQSNRRGLFLTTLPYKVGIVTAVTAAVVSIPMCFEINTVLAFNEGVK